MSHANLVEPHRARPARRVPRAVVLVLLGALMCALSYMIPERSLALGVMTGGIVFLLVGLGSGLRRQAGVSDGTQAQSVLHLLEHDESPCFVTDADGEITERNAAARGDLAAEATTASAALSAVLSSPSKLIERLALKAGEAGSAREDIVTRNGHVRLVCTRLEIGGALWRLERLPALMGETASAYSDKLPMLVIGRQNTVLFMNAAARNLLGGRTKSLDAVFAHPPMRLGRVQKVLGPDGPIDCVVTEIAANARRQEIALIPIETDHIEIPESMRFFDELPVPLLKLAPDGLVISSNRMARDLLGKDEIVGESLGNLLEGLGRSIRDWLQDTILGRASKHSEFLKVRRHDYETFVQVILKPAVEDSKDVLVAVLNDATELKTLEAQFVQSQKMQAIGQLAGGVAHDFNNLLTAISGHCDLLMLGRAEDDADFSDLEQINQNANRAAALVSQLLAFSRKQTLRPETIDIQETLSALTHLLNRLVGEAIILEFSHTAECAMIRADKRQLEQVVMNLVVNARDAMPRGGTVSIVTQTIRLQQPLERDRATVPPGRYVSVKVIDEGKGIPPEKLQKIFEPFFTTKRTGEGTGLGLSTAYGIVKQTGGFIFADSEPGKGSCFTLMFPSHAEEAVPSSEPVMAAEPAEPERRDAVILLAEDEAPVRAFASRALKLKGFSVIEAGSGEEALDMLADMSLHVDIFVSDVMMPGRKGPEWVAQALEVRPDVRVVFVSGYAEDAFRDDGPNIEGALFLQKPFSLAELANIVQIALSDE